MADDFNPYSAPQTTVSQPVIEEGSGLKSLGQEARKASINKARWIMIIAGLWQLGISSVEYSNFDQAIRNEFQRDRIVLNADQLATIKGQLLPYVYVFMVGGATLVLMGIFVKQFPVPLTIAGLVVYVGIHLVFATLSVHTLYQGWIIKVLIIAGLWSAIQAALAYEKERRMAPYGEF